MIPLAVEYQKLYTNFNMRTGNADFLDDEENYKSSKTVNGK